MKRIDLLTYLLVADPNKETKKTLGKLNMQSEVVGIEMSGENAIDVWCEPRKEQKENDNMSYDNLLLKKELSKTYSVHTVDTQKGEIVATRKVDVAVNTGPSYRLC